MIGQALTGGGDVPGGIVTIPRRRRRLTAKAVAGLALAATVLVMSLLAPQIAPHDPNEQTIDERLRPPAFQSGGTWTYPLGTDGLGRDLLSRIIYGSRISLLVGFVAVTISGALGTAAGLLSGYYGGVLDALTMRLLDVQLAIPFLVLSLMIVAVFGGGLLKIILVLGLTGWVFYARVVRGEVLALRAREFVESARAVGASPARILFRHVLPNVIHSAIVISTLEVGSMILAEASLSFLGLGVQPPTPSWGGMVADGRDYLATAWWVATMPGIAIILTVLGATLLGDWLRDIFDPRLQWTQ